MNCRTLDQVRAAGREAGNALGPITQDQADLVAAILTPHIDVVLAA